MLVIASAFNSQRYIAVLGNNLPIEAGAAACMAGRPVTGDAHFQPKRIPVTIRSQLDNALQIA